MANKGSSCCCKLFVFLVFLVLILGVAALVIWLLLRPANLTVYAETAAINEFSLVDNNTISYNLNVELAVRNPNRRVGLYYDYINATASYGGFRFGVDDVVGKFYQGHKNTTDIVAFFAGERVVDSTDNDLVTLGDRFNVAAADGFYDVVLELNMRVRFKVWSVTTNRYSPYAKCELKLPAPESGGEFQRTKCHVDLEFL